MDVIEELKFCENLKKRDGVGREVRFGGVRVDVIEELKGGRGGGGGRRGAG